MKMNMDFATITTIDTIDTLDTVFTIAPTIIIIIIVTKSNTESTFTILMSLFFQLFSITLRIIDFFVRPLTKRCDVLDTCLI